MPVITTNSPEETAALGRRLGELLLPGDFIALTGDLGAGKTQFVKGVAEGVGVDPAIPITSPTFTIMNAYEGRIPLYHFDLYRIAGDADVAELGFAEFFYGAGACIVEWSERLSHEIPPERLVIAFSHEGETSRCLEFTPVGQRGADIIARLFPQLEQ
ncbi:MAG: tRNA (adenosine(37)-N6)-threonylcarbamoyltransferase complex ATPase subunit type 1 TsaE [Geobacter sp.]|nr:tRNA (adenosine(37)-N6)-threonylcarbamoyltransferase complex ATPase subunit type 1 TsaE [Geobacter sp.]